jgi:hypothetical protein
MIDRPNFAVRWHQGTWGHMSASILLLLIVLTHHFGGQKTTGLGIFKLFGIFQASSSWQLVWSYKFSYINPTLSINTK